MTCWNVTSYTKIITLRSKCCRLYDIMESMYDVSISRTDSKEEAQRAVITEKARSPDIVFRPFHNYAKGLVPQGAFTRRLVLWR